MRTSIVAYLVLSFSSGAFAAEPSISAVEKEFRELPMEARRLTGPLFWMHGDETRAQLEGELQKVLEGGNGVFTTEPRPHNDWLGEGWYRDLDICLEFARKNTLKMIIYDDWWWPSQMMGGRVPPQYGSKRLEAAAVSVEGPQSLRESGYGDTNLVAVVAGRVAEGEAVEGKSLVNLTASVRDGALAWEVPAGTWKIMKFTWQFNGNRGGQQRYISVDGASPDCVEWFVKTVYQPHYDRFGKDFGKTIVGYFYDEPETQGDWGSDVPKLIAERKLDLATLLVSYKFKLAGEEQVAAFQTYLNMFAESWGRTMYGGMSKWCKAHGVFSMGHFMEHNDDMFSRGMSGGNMMQLQEHSDMGGIDLVCNQLYPGQRPMGLYQMAKIASSISHTYNKADDIAFCEIYGGYGQGLTYPQMKWLADWHHVRGVNLLIPHSFNPRAPYDDDFPPYFYNGGFEPRWPLYRVWADYSSRLSLMLTGGKHICPVAFLHVGQSIHSGRTIRPEGLTSTLQDALYDCDWLNYDAFENDARLAGKEIILHKENYQMLIVPPVEIIPYATLEKAKQFFDQGGVVVGYGFLPSKSATLGKTSADIAALCGAIWGEKPDSGAGLCRSNGKGGRSYFLPEQPSVEEVTKCLAKDAGIPPVLEVVEGETGNWLHVLHRQKSGQDVFLLCNQNLEGSPRKFKFRTDTAGTPECWDAMRNELSSVPFQRDGKQVEFDLTLEPSESVLLVFQSKDRKLPARIEEGAKPPREPIPLVRDTSIVDPVPRPRGSEKKSKLKGCSWVWFEAKAAESAPAGKRYFRKSIVLPTDRKVKSARIVLAADNEATLVVNGQQAGRSPDWLQPTELDITKSLKPGRNQLAILAVNATDQPSPAGLIGRYEVCFDSGEPEAGKIDDAWRATDQEQSGWDQADFDDSAWPQAKVVAALGQGPWGRLDGNNKLAMSPVVADIFHGHCALPADTDLSRARIYLECDELTPEAAARVTVNGVYAGGFIGKPFRLDVTQHLKAGQNTFAITPFAPKTARLVVY